MRPCRRVRIERRFRGPPETGNGGYVAGLVAAALGGSNCTVTLKSPPPIDEDLTLTTEDASASLIVGRYGGRDGQPASRSR